MHARKGIKRLRGYYIDKYELSNEQYNRFLNHIKRVSLVKYKKYRSKYYRNPELSADEHPVVGITWEAAQAYAEWSGKKLPLYL